VSPRKRFGQHFLAPAWADKVVRAIAPARDELFLEIGPGPGALTLRLASRVDHLTAIEIDRDLVAALQPQLPRNVDLVVGDILDIDLARYLVAGPLRIAGNLPYNISSPIIFKLLATARQSPDLLDATVMLQLEVAERLAAKPGTKDYGVLTIFTALQADVQRVLTLPPGAFRPAPKVHSTVLRLEPHEAQPPVVSESVFRALVAAVFTRRRKTLSNALLAFHLSGQRRPGPSGPGTELSPNAALDRAGLDGRRRPETLSLEEFARLADVFAQTRDPSQI